MNKFNNKIVIFGIDNISRGYANHFIEEHSDIKIEYFVTEENIEGTTNISGIEVRLIEEFLIEEKSNILILIVSNHTSRYKKLISLGLEEDKDFIVIPVLGLVRLYTTSICNASCAMCDIGVANGKGIDRLRKSMNTEISMDIIKKLLSEQYLKENKLKFSIGMVEPLIHHKIGNIIGLIKQGGHSVAILTNGILLEKKAKELIENKVDYVVVSIDGPEEIHDRIRGRKGIYEKAIKGIKMLHKLNPELRVVVNCAVSNLNYNYIFDLVKSLEKEELEVEIQFQHLYFVSSEMAKKHNNMNFDNIKQSKSVVSDTISPKKVNIDILKKQIENIEQLTNLKYIKKIRIRPKFDLYEELYNYYNDDGNKISNYDKCFFPFNQLSIKTDGDILFHSRCFNYVIGNILEDNITDIFLGAKAKYFRQKLKESEYCFPACTRCCGVMGGW